MTAHKAMWVKFKENAEKEREGRKTRARAERMQIDSEDFARLAEAIGLKSDRVTELISRGGVGGVKIRVVPESRRSINIRLTPEDVVNVAKATKHLGLNQSELFRCLARTVAEIADREAEG